MITNFETSFVVMPKDCNYLGDMLFGGALLAHMDIAAAMAVRRTLYSSEVKTALTVAVNNVTFLVGATIGDLIFLKATIIKLGIKSLTILVEGHRENQYNGTIDKICTGEFVFCAVDKDRKPARHCLTMEQVEWATERSKNSY